MDVGLRGLSGFAIFVDFLDCLAAVEGIEAFVFPPHLLEMKLDGFKIGPQPGKPFPNQSPYLSLFHGNTK
jgi:hypothetical protein